MERQKVSLRTFIFLIFIQFLYIPVHDKLLSMVICGIFVLLVFSCIPFSMGLNINYTIIFRNFACIDIFIIENRYFAKNITEKIASEMPVPHSLGKYFQHHEIQKYCISTNFRILSEHCQLYKGPNNV